MSTIPVTLLDQETGPPDESETGECRHHCNGSHVLGGYPDPVCDWLCHPGLEPDPERAARHDDLIGALTAAAPNPDSPRCIPGPLMVPSARDLA